MIPISTTTTVRRTLRLAVAVATVVGFSACSSDDDAASDSAAPDDTAGTTDAPGDSGIAAGPVDAAIADFAFGPDPVEVVSGNTVTWTNTDGAAHTVTGTGELEFDSGSIPSGESFTLAVDSVGEFAYVCTIHGQMSGTLIST